ncbi:Cilia and flagella associated protein 61 [Desmophyllum pertusum]|uniref:Cilia and flagella associated protein 61 n=1 Tax=Desmophyllum pertusum TaxID=174260 RepID=A0A9W9ZB57_9CNID|nr:Cilia and flagella associated protein 61 [Desmophyllum pertusum]
MNYFVAKSDFAYGCATEIIRTVFNAVPFLHYIFLVVPRGVETGSTLTELFKPMAFKESFTGRLNIEVQVCHRHDHCAKLHIRSARVEDHDDLTPIFNRQSDVLTSTYGDFFLAELIEAQDEKINVLLQM